MSGSLRLGLISDTHIPEAGNELPSQVYEALQGVDLILHAGDMHIIDVLDWLESIAPVIGARGNGDGDGVRPFFPDNDPRVKASHVVKVDDLKIGLVHGFPLAEEVPWTSWENLMDRHFGGDVDIIVCGDTHVTLVHEHNGVLMVNPGSATMPNNLMSQLGNLAILTIENGIPNVEMIQL